MFTFSLYGTLVGVSGLDETGVNSADADSPDSARLLMPLVSLPVLGEARPESGEFLEFCSFSSLRSFTFNAEKCSGSRPINGSVNINAMILVLLALVYLFLTRILRPKMEVYDNIVMIFTRPLIVYRFNFSDFYYMYYKYVFRIFWYFITLLLVSTFCITTLFKSFKMQKKMNAFIVTVKSNF